MSTGLSVHIILLILYSVLCLSYLAKMDVDYTDGDIEFNFITILFSIIFLPGFIIFCIIVLFKWLIK